MQALKAFLKSYHFYTLLALSCLVMFLFSGIINFPEDQTLRSARASISSHSTPPSFFQDADDFTGIIEDGYSEIRGKLTKGDTLARSFSRTNVPHMIRNQIIKALKPKISFSSLMPGDRYSIIINPDGQLVRCVYERSPLESYTIKSRDNEYCAEKNEVLLEARTIRISGQVDTSLFTAFPSDIKSARLIYSFADIFASKIDFNTETRSGDEFSLLVEEYYKFDEFIGYGPIQAAIYTQANGDVHEGYLYNNGSRDSYYDADGNELGASFIKSPVQVGRISSRFTNRRMHPILGVIKKHLGVDLAAPHGTPIMAAADGRITMMRTNGGFGKQIVLSHGGNYRTHYGHLSKFRKGLQVGSKVRQKQIIGYVGSTGLATGPHLDYRLQHQGVYKNPFGVKFRPRSVLKGGELALHKENASSYNALLVAEKSSPVLHVETLLLGSDSKLSLL